MTRPPDSLAPDSLAAQLAALPGRIGRERSSVGEVVDALGDNAPWLTLVVLTLPTFIPIPGLPTGFLAAIVAILIGVRLLRGHHGIALPRWLRRIGLRRAHIVMAVERGLPMVTRLERWADGRPKALGAAGMGPPAMAVFLGLLLMVPLPLANQAPAIGLVVLGIGVLLRHRGTLRAGFAMGPLSVVWVGLLIALSAGLGVAVFDWFGR